MEDTQKAASALEIQGEKQEETAKNSSQPNIGVFAKVNKVVEKLNNTMLMIDKKKEKEFLVQSNFSAQNIISSLQDKKAILLRNKMMQQRLDEFENKKILDFDDKDTCSLVIHLLQKQIKSQQEIQFLGKFIRLLSVFKENEELLQTSQMSNRIIQNLRCVFIKKHNPLFKYGDRGHEYFILLQGKAYCLIPYSNLIPQEIINQQTKQKRLFPQVIDDPSDEDFLFNNFPKHQCVKIYKPGEAFGEIALLTTENKRMASIICKEECWFMSLNKEGFNQIQGSYQQHLLNEKVYFMKKFEIFKPVAVNKILSFLHDTHQKSFIMGQSIYTQGQKSDMIYFIIEGEVEIIQELTQVGTSKLSNQKYEQYFKNTKHLTIQKEIVLLGADNYFGDEDIISTDKIHQYSAVCRSQTCKVLEVELRILATFLKVYDMLSLFKKTAQNKKNHYQQILQEDIVLNTKKIVESQQMQKKKQKVKDEFNFQSENLYDDYQLQGEYNALDENKSQTHDKTNVPSPQNTDRVSTNNDSIDLSHSAPPQSFVPKFHNVYTHIANQNMRQKNYLSLNNAYQSTAKFTLEDVPMTTKMNQDETDLRRVQFRLSKNICKSMESKGVPSVPYQKSSSIFSNKLYSKLTKSFNVSFESLPQINQSYQSHQNSNLNQEYPERKMQIINLNSDLMKVQEQFNEKQKNLLFSEKLKSVSTPNSIKNAILNSISSPKSKFLNYLTPQHKLKHSDSTVDAFSKKYSINSPRENSSSFALQSSNSIVLKHSKKVTDYQENLIQRKRHNTSQISHHIDS